MLFVKKIIRSEKIILVIILFIALTLRIYKLSSKSLWLDEGLALWIANRDSIPSLFKELSYNLHPPVYYLILHYWLKIFGASEIALRSISVISGVASVFMTYKIGKIIYNKHVGLISSFLSAISIFLINYSQEGKSCSFTCFLTTVSTYFFIKYLQTNKFKNLAWYTTTGSILILTHSSGLFIVLSHFIYILISRAGKFKDLTVDIKKVLLAQGIITGIATIWSLTIKDQIPIRKGYIIVWIREPSVQTLIDTFKDYYSGSTFTFVIFLLFLLIALFNKEKSKTTLVFTLGILPPILLFMVSKFWQPLYLHRYTIGASISFYILVAKGILMTKPTTRILGILFIILSSFELLYNYHLSSYPYIYKAIDWKKAVSVVEKNATNKDLIVFDAWYIKRFLFDYYSKREDLIKTNFGYNIAKPDYKKIAEELKTQLKRYKRVWLINYHMDDKEMYIEKSIRKNYKLTNDWKFNEKYSYDKLEIKLYESE